VRGRSEQVRAQTHIGFRVLPTTEFPQTASVEPIAARHPDERSREPCPERRRRLGGGEPLGLYAGARWGCDSRGV
jgi:hypothetical protein